MTNFIVRCLNNGVYVSVKNRLCKQWEHLSHANPHTYGTWEYLRLALAGTRHFVAFMIHLYTGGRFVLVDITAGTQRERQIQLIWVPDTNCATQILSLFWLLNKSIFLFHIKTDYSQYCVSTEHRMWNALCHCLAMWKRNGRFLSRRVQVNVFKVRIFLWPFEENDRNKQLQWLANKISLLLIFYICKRPSAKIFQLILCSTSSSILSSKFRSGTKRYNILSRNATFPIYFVCIDHLVLLFNFITFAWLNSLRSSMRLYLLDSSFGVVSFSLVCSCCTHLPTRAKWEV